jgi:hypothetical protein
VISVILLVFVYFSTFCSCDHIDIDIIIYIYIYYYFGIYVCGCLYICIYDQSIIIIIKTTIVCLSSKYS